MSCEVLGEKCELKVVLLRVEYRHTDDTGWIDEHRFFFCCAEEKRMNTGWPRIITNLPAGRFVARKGIQLRMDNYTFIYYKMICITTPNY
jgi:hypothetical protein